MSEVKISRLTSHVSHFKPIVMKSVFIKTILLCVFTGICFFAFCNQPVPAVADLRCEYRDNPIGIDITQPNLGWFIQAPLTGNNKNIAQTAYQIIVASTPELLQQNIGDLWDSKKILSDNSTHVIYGEASQGKQAASLASSQRCYWKVRVWTKSGDNKEVMSAWSKAALWSMGLLNKSDWVGKWIGLNKDTDNYDTATEHRRLAARMLRREFAVHDKRSY